MPGRIQSPSSINTFRQCPRKYYYQYICKLPGLPSIHLIRGRVVHKVLEDFWDVETQELRKESFREQLSKMMGQLFVTSWTNAQQELGALTLSDTQLAKYCEESLLMLSNWFSVTARKIEEYPAHSFQDAFNGLKPRREVRYLNTKHRVQGYIDAIEEDGSFVRILDYKTSKKFEITEDYRLQLGIYALMYFEEHGRLPTESGIFFLKHGAKYLEVNAPLLQFARNEIASVHDNTTSVTIRDYPQKPSALCKWSTGQCDFYEHCFGDKPTDPLAEKEQQTTLVDVPLNAIKIE